MENLMAPGMLKCSRLCKISKLTRIISVASALGVQLNISLSLWKRKRERDDVLICQCGEVWTHPHHRVDVFVWKWALCEVVVSGGWELTCRLVCCPLKRFRPTAVIPRKPRNMHYCMAGRADKTEDLCSWITVWDVKEWLKITETRRDNTVIWQ